MNVMLRYFIYALWCIPVLAILFVLFFVHYDRPTREQRARAQLDWWLAPERARMQRQNEEVRAREAKAKEDFEAYVVEVTALIGQVESRWRADVDAAGATGKPGVVPPMLDIQEQGRAVIVTNKLGDQPVCVSLRRVARAPASTNGFERCLLDRDTCRELRPKASFRFQLYSAGNSPACMNAPLEFRVGTPFSPEPSWWTDSAVVDFDHRPPRERLTRMSQEDWPLHGSREAMRALLEEKERPARWRRELGLPSIETKVERD